MVIHLDLTQRIRFALGSRARRFCECFQLLRVSLRRGAYKNVFFH